MKYLTLTKTKENRGFIQYFLFSLLFLKKASKKLPKKLHFSSFLGPMKYPTLTKIEENRVFIQHFLFSLLFFKENKQKAS